MTINLVQDVTETVIPPDCLKGQRMQTMRNHSYLREGSQFLSTSQHAREKLTYPRCTAPANSPHHTHQCSAPETQDKQTTLNLKSVKEYVNFNIKQCTEFNTLHSVVNIVLDVLQKTCGESLSSSSSSSSCNYVNY